MANNEKNKEAESTSYYRKLACIGFQHHRHCASSKSHYIDLQPDGLSRESMHYVTQGSPNGQKLLMIHGWPTSNRLYKHVMDELCGGSSGEYYCIAPSQIGFGKSSCPGSGHSFSPSMASAYLIEFIKEMGLSNYVGIVHDWGGPTGVAAMLKNHAVIRLGNL